MLEKAHRLVVMYRRQAITGRTFHIRMNGLIALAHRMARDDMASELVTLLSIA
jgi:hypothetical protein